MDSFRKILDRLAVSWRAMSFNQRAIVTLVLAASVISSLIFGLWLRSDSMVVLYSGLTPEDAAAAMDHAAGQGVKVELRNGGSTILVPSEHRDRLRMELAVEGVGGDGLRGWDLFDETVLGETEFGMNVRLKRAIEGELSRSIQSIEGVQRARVHLSLPKKSLFARGGPEATASVLLSLNGRRAPNQEQIGGVQQLVASAVEDLEAQRVSVIDAASGRVLSSNDADDLMGLSSAQWRQRREAEDYLARKASRAIEPMLGAGSFEVAVNADLDFRELQRTSISYGQQTALRSEEIQESGGGDDGATTSLTRTNNEIPQTNEVLSESGSVLRRLSVTVTVDGSYADPGDGSAPVYQPRNQTELDNIRDAVSSAIGFDASRGDQISVVNMQFRLPEPIEPSLLDSPWLSDLPSMVGRILLFLVAAILILSLRRSAGQMLGEAGKGGSGGGGQGLGAAGGEVGVVFPQGRSVASEVSSLEDWARSDPEDVASMIQAFATQED